MDATIGVSLCEVFHGWVLLLYLVSRTFLACALDVVMLAVALVELYLGWGVGDGLWGCTFSIGVRRHCLSDGGCHIRYREVMPCFVAVSVLGP